MSDESGQKILIRDYSFCCFFLSQNDMFFFFCF